MVTLLWHYLRRSWLLGLAAAIAVCVFMALLSRVFAQMNVAGPNPLASLMPRWVKSVFSIEPEAMSEFTGYLSIGFQHPFVLILTLALPVTFATAFLTGDVERRTLSLVLSRPISRLHVVLATALICLLWCEITVGGVMLGTMIGHKWAAIPQPLDLGRLLRTGLAFYALVVAFIGISLALAAMFSERGDAIGWCVTIVLVMYVWNFLSQMLSGAGTFIPNYSLFRLYAPTGILMRGEWNASHVQLLAAIGAIGTIAALLIFRMRNFNL